LRGAFFKKKKAMRYYGRPKRYIRESGIPVYGLKTHHGFLALPHVTPFPISLMNGW